MGDGECGVGVSGIGVESTLGGREGGVHVASEFVSVGEGEVGWNSGLERDELLAEIDCLSEGLGIARLLEARGECLKSGWKVGVDGDRSACCDDGRSVVVCLCISARECDDWVGRIGGEVSGLEEGLDGFDGLSSVEQSESKVEVWSGEPWGGIDRPMKRFNSGVERTPHSQADAEIREDPRVAGAEAIGTLP